MKNAQSPVFPIVNTDGFTTTLEIIEQSEKEHKIAIGLTKREYFAGLAMQALFSDNSRIYRSAKVICIDALEVADELLKQLEK